MEKNYTGYTIETASKILDVSHHTIISWLRQYDPETGSTKLEYVYPFAEGMEPNPDNKPNPVRISRSSIERRLNQRTQENMNV